MILTSAADPNIALALVVLGALCVYVEFVKPGTVIPGAFGSVFVLLGMKTLGAFTPAQLLDGRIDFRIATGLGVPFALITCFLLSVALRARRNKLGANA